jgi:hypothetical protein
MGTPRHQVTPQTQQTVEQAAGLGLPLDMVASLVGITQKTLRVRYRQQIAQGKAKCAFAVGKTLFERATKDRDTGALIWWTKTQMGWKEASREVEVYTPPGKALHVTGGQELLRDFYERSARAVAEASAAEGDPDLGRDRSEGDLPAGDPDAGEG